MICKWEFKDGIVFEGNYFVVRFGLGVLLRFEILGFVGLSFGLVVYVLGELG